ncbi:MAG: flagellar basal body rod protein FlgB [Nitrosomonas sp.]|uniref:flagellar basal body rod protein FlgB n=1 Tax=Nitrosomonas sp. TaxID=42353 RepID=UPI000AC82958|nr:flagellar basal body rod protein FlgB [Nitrosomonas sp.]MDP3662520.1 flagellar basal body rod protein FlgB [Nitrosomonas sp.]MDZ4106907.1 flagellar basal body rod protein FlgB [Nitrosomonas sp.]HRB20961.1 flagellar basal body rod protein FlgB [Nitrosomonas sp.]
MLISKLDKNKELDLYHQALNLRVARQELLSSNVANADTPNFKAKDIDFSSVLREKLALTTNTTKVGLITTSSGHISTDPTGILEGNLLYRVPLQPSADGNTVDMNMERTQFADNAIKYDVIITLLNDNFNDLSLALQER